MNSSRAGMATVGKVQIAYERFGRRGDPAMLLAMGLGTQMVAWDEAFCRRLAGHGIEVIRFDNRDVGQSTHWVRGACPDLEALGRAMAQGRQLTVPYTLVDLARDTTGLMDALAIDRAHFAGLSMGGMIGQEMAVHCPDRMLSLTSIMSTTGAPHLPPPTSAALEVLMKPFPTDRDGYIEAFVAAFHILSGPIHPIRDTMVRRWAALHYARGLNPDGIVRQMAAIMASGDRTMRLQGVRVPTLVLHGSEDPLLPLDHGRATAQAIPGAQLVVVDGMGHAIPESLWDAIIGHIGRFVT